MLTSIPLTSKNPFSSLHGIEKRVPCGDTSHYQPLFFPTACHHPNKVLVADLEQGMGTLIHAGSKRNPSFGLWPLSHALVQATKRELESGNGTSAEEEGQQQVMEDVPPETTAAISLSAFLRENIEDADWEIVEPPAPAKEKFVLVGKRQVGTA